MNMNILIEEKKGTLCSISIPMRVFYVFINFAKLKDDSFLSF